MVRKNIFKANLDDIEEVPSQNFSQKSALSHMRHGLKDLAENSVREVKTDFILDSEVRDRLPFTEDAVADLISSIQTYGQQIPILVRYIKDRPGYYEIVYGRRRLMALKALGLSAKTIIRDIDDRNALFIQAQENHYRINPSFIEDAMMASSLKAKGMSTEDVAEAINTHKATISRMSHVANSIPYILIEIIGPAPGTGRRPWLELADMLAANKLDTDTIIQKLQEQIDMEIATSDDRFKSVFQIVQEMIFRGPNEADETDETAETDAQKGMAPSPPAERSLSFKPDVPRIAIGDGFSFGTVKQSDKSVVISINVKKSTEFGDWLVANAERFLPSLYDEWQKDQPGEN
jgi:ParB family chromosome partitioning protein